MIDAYDFEQLVPAESRRGVLHSGASVQTLGRDGRNDGNHLLAASCLQQQQFN